MATLMSPSGLYKPEDDDSGSTFWDQVVALFQSHNDHNHNGSNSSPIIKTQSISSASWSESPASSGIYQQTITLSGALTYDTIMMQFRNASTGDIIHPTIEKLTSTTYRVKVNDSSLNLTAIYV